MKNAVLLLSAISMAVSINVNAGTNSGVVSDKVVAEQRANLSTNTQGKGFGPQSPRNIDEKSGANKIAFNKAPPYQKMNLCNIHFHKNAEHAGGQFSNYAGNGDGKGSDTGYVYSGELTASEKTPLSEQVCVGKHGGLQSGDTIELHYVHSSAMVNPGPTLGACLSESIMNPQLRVETQVFVLVNDEEALNFLDATKVGKENGYNQALNIPRKMGKPVTYSGSTTGPSYNEKASPLQVTWNVRPKVAKVNAASVGQWCERNIFKEDHAHGVRNLVTNPELLSPIK